MGFWNALFGGKELSPEEEREEQKAKNFDLLKYDGVKAMKTGQAEYAVRCFNEALKLQDDLEIHDYLSQTLLRMGNLDGCMQQLQTLFRAEPENIQIQIRMAQVAYMLEDYEAMSEAAQRAIEIDGNAAPAYYLAAQAKLGQQDVVSGIALLTKAIALDENYADAYLLRGQTLLAMGDAASAGKDGEWLAEHVGDQEDALLFRARIAESMGQKETANALYEKIKEVNPFWLQDVSGDFTGEGIEEQVKRAYSAVNPLGL